VLTVHTDTPVHPTDAARDLIGAVVPTFGHALDPMRSITAAARLVQGATAGVVVTRAGRLLALPGLPAHPLLTAGSLVLAEVARHLAGDGEYTQFLRPAPGPAPTTGHVRVAALDCAVDRAGPRDVPVRRTRPGSRCARRCRSRGRRGHRVSAAGHAHIDPAWLWPVRETMRKVARTTAGVAVTKAWGLGEQQQQFS
jgi:hypothetical protein